MRRLQCDLIKAVVGKQSLPVMLDVLAEPGTPGEEGRTQLRYCAIEALGTTDDELARERLRALLREPGTARAELSYVVQSLGRLRDTTAVPDLVRLLRSADGTGSASISMPPGVIRSQAAEALSLIGTRESAAPLFEFLTSVAPAWRKAHAEPVMRNLREAISRTRDRGLATELLHDRIRKLTYGE